MDNEFNFDEYSFSDEVQTTEPEAVEAVATEAPVAAAKKKKLDFKFSPKMLIAPGVALALIIVAGGLDAIVTLIGDLIYGSLGYEFNWLVNLILGITTFFSIAVELVIIAGVGYFVYKNISKALKFAGVVFAAWATGRIVGGVVSFIVSIISQVLINNGDFGVYSVVTTVGNIISGIGVTVLSLIAAFLFMLLIEKADAKEAEERIRGEESKAEENIGEVIEEEASEKAEESKKKKLPINKKTAIFMAAAALIIALVAVPFVILNFIPIQSKQSWIYIVGGLQSLLTFLVTVAACGGMGFLATKKLDGAIKFLGAYELAAKVVSLFSTIIFTALNLLFSLIGVSSVVYSITSTVVQIPVIIITAVLAIAVVHLFDMGINFKKKSKVGEAAAEVKEEIEDVVEESEEAVEEVVEVSYE